MMNQLQEMMEGCTDAMRILSCLVELENEFCFLPIFSSVNPVKILIYPHAPFITGLSFPQSQAADETTSVIMRREISKRLGISEWTRTGDELNKVCAKVGKASIEIYPYPKNFIVECEKVCMAVMEDGTRKPIKDLPPITADE